MYNIVSFTLKKNCLVPEDVLIAMSFGQSVALFCVSMQKAIMADWCMRDVFV